MAIDRWLLLQHRQGHHPPTLRFYTFSPVAISLGYHQRHYPEFWHELIWQGKSMELVRRPTGGRAVLHQGDLTYMVVNSGLPNQRAETYEKICKFLIEGWRSLGVELHYGSAGRGYIHNPNCFGTATNADLITSEGRKLIGSAQLRQGNAILQHGSILLKPDLFLFQQVFGSALVSVGEIGEIASAHIIQALTEAAIQCFEIELIAQPLSEAEHQEILKLITDN